MPRPTVHESAFRRRLRLRLHHQLRRLTLWPLALVLMLTLSLQGLTAYLLNAARRVDAAFAVVAKITHVDKLAVDRESGLRGYRITDDPAFLEPFEGANASLAAELDALEALVRDNPSQLAKLQQLREALRAWDDFAAGVQERVAAGIPTDLTSQLRGKVLMDAVRAHVDAMLGHEHALLSAHSRDLARVRMFIMPAIPVAGILFAPLLVISIRRTLAHLDTCYRAAWDESDRQREQLEVTLSSIGDAVIVTDRAGSVTYLNPVAVALTGWPAEEARGQPIETVVNLIDEPTRDPVESPVTLVLRAGNIVALASQPLLIAKDGREIPGADSAAPIRDPDGQITGVVMVFRDQTEERKAQQDAAEKIRLLDLTTDAILIRNVEGFIVYWNHGAENMYGWSREEALGRRSHDLLKTEFPKPFDEITEELYRTDHWTGEFVHTTRDGRRITVLARKALDRDHEGKPAAILQTLTDITERKREEETLSRIAAIIDSSNDAILSKDLNGVITSWNAAAERLFGYTALEAIGQPVTLLIPPDQADKEPHILARIRKGERLEHFETIRRRKDGTLCDVSLTISPIRDGKGRIVGSSKIVRDITERKRAQEALRESEERFRTMANSMPQLAWTAQGDGYIHWYNQRWYEYTGTTLEEMEGWGWQSVHDAAELSKVLERWKASIATGDPFEMTFPLRGADGVFRAFLTRVIPLKNAAGKVVQWFGTNTEIDDVMLTQERLVHAQAQLADRAVQLEGLVAERTAKLRAAHLRLLAEADERKRLEAEIADAVESERERLGQELHDGLAQELTGIGMLLHVLEREMKEPAPPFAAEAGRLCRMVEKAQENARNLAKSFYPVELEQHGLLVALQNLALGAQERFGVACVVEAARGAPARLRDTRAVHLFRIAQEAIHNAAKHAAAKEVRVALAKRGGTWLLTIKDNGVGLPADAQTTTGMGLRIMHYRARMIGGTLEVRNDDGGGVLVSCAVPATEGQMTRSRPSIADASSARVDPGGL